LLFPFPLSFYFPCSSYSFNCNWIFVLFLLHSFHSFIYWCLCTIHMMFV
jgi:hypothetical protein